MWEQLKTWPWCEAADHWHIAANIAAFCVPESTKTVWHELDASRLVLSPIRCACDCLQLRASEHTITWAQTSKRAYMASAGASLLACCLQNTCRGLSTPATVAPDCPWEASGMILLSGSFPADWLLTPILKAGAGAAALVGSLAVCML